MPGLLGGVVNKPLNYLIDLSKVAHITERHMSVNTCAGKAMLHEKRT